MNKLTNQKDDTTDQKDTIEMIDIEIVIKNDFELSKNEINGIFTVYHECFYDNKLKANQYELVKKWLSKYKIFKWYIAKIDNRIIGIAAFVYDYKNVKIYDIRQDKDVNICNVGVLEKYRKNGIARLLMKQIISDYDHKDLVVEIKRGTDDFYRILRTFYLSLGFNEYDIDNPLNEKHLYMRLKSIKDS